MSERVKTLGLMLSLICVSWWMRSPSFTQSVIDHDESTYIVISEAFWSGARLYTDVWDTKPAGVFMMLGAMFKLFGSSVWITRVFTALLVAFTGWLLYCTKRVWGHPWGESALSGLLWVVMVSSPMFGLSGHIELFFMVWVALGLTLLSAASRESSLGFTQDIRRASLYLTFGAGVALGLGFITKYVVLLDALAFGIALIGWPMIRALKSRACLSDHNARGDMSPKSSYEPGSLTHHTQRALLYLLGGVIPFLGLHLFFYLQGNFAAFYEVTYLIPRRYVSHGDPEVAWRMLKDFHMTYDWALVPLYISFGWAGIQRLREVWGYDSAQEARLGYQRVKSGDTLCALWYLSVWAAVLIPGKPFTHYYLHLCASVACFAPRCLTWGSGLITEVFEMSPSVSRRERGAQVRERYIASLILILSAGLMLGYADHRVEHHTRHFKRRVDIPRVVARYLKPRLRPEDLIYTANFDHILYHLLALRSPTPYVHRSLLTNPKHLKTLQLDPRVELKRILAMKPRFILTVGHYRHAVLRAALRRDYRRVKIFGRRYWIYERIIPK